MMELHGAGSGMDLGERGRERERDGSEGIALLYRC